VYCRISQDRLGDGLSVERQREDCLALARSLGWLLAQTYVDEAVSAYSAQRRHAYRRLLADVASGDRDGIVCWHPDRLHRSLVEFEECIELVERTGVRLVTCRAGE
jgi:DNA invertase Pin-like site-specific DNA recombinase